MAEIKVDVVFVFLFSLSSYSNIDSKEDMFSVELIRCDLCSLPALAEYTSLSMSKQKL